MEILLISGHSLQDSGAVSGSRKENLETIEFKRLIKSAILQQRPETKVYTDDDSDNLNTVISKARANVSKGSILFDIHINSASPSARGTETFVRKTSTEKDRRIADKINKITSSILDTPNRGVKTEDQTRHGRLGILHTGAETAILWEVDFISNKSAMEKIDKWRHWLSWEIATILINEIGK